MKVLLGLLLLSQVTPVTIVAEPRHVTIPCLNAMEAALQASHEAYGPGDWTVISSGSITMGQWSTGSEDEVAKLERELAEAKGRKAATEERYRREEKARSTYETALDRCGRRDFSPIP